MWGKWTLRGKSTQSFSTLCSPKPSHPSLKHHQGNAGPKKVTVHFQTAQEKPCSWLPHSPDGPYSKMSYQPLRLPGLAAGFLRPHLFRFPLGCEQKVQTPLPGFYELRNVCVIFPSTIIPSTKLSAQDDPQDFGDGRPSLHCAELTYPPAQDSLPQACLALQPPGWSSGPQALLV